MEEIINADINYTLGGKAKGKTFIAVNAEGAGYIYLMLNFPKTYMLIFIMKPVEVDSRLDAQLWQIF